MPCEDEWDSIEFVADLAVARKEYAMKIGLITGASSGLGAAYARLLDREGLDELWLAARRGERLKELAGQLKTPARCFALDLTEEASLEVISRALSQLAPEVCFLINAAGFGRIGRTADIPARDIAAMTRLNAIAPTLLVSLALPFMRKGDRIMNIASCAAFQPTPDLAVYAATKAFLLSYSRALAAELSPQGIGVTAVCPYWIRDTEFISRAQVTDRQHLFQGFPFATDVESVARRSLRAAKDGARVCTPDAISFLDRLVAKALPRGILMRLMELWHRL